MMKNAIAALSKYVEHHQSLYSDDGDVGHLDTARTHIFVLRQFFKGMSVENVFVSEDEDVSLAIENDIMEYKEALVRAADDLYKVLDAQIDAIPDKEYAAEQRADVERDYASFND